MEHTKETPHAEAGEVKLEDLENDDDAQPVHWRTWVVVYTAALQYSTCLRILHCSSEKVADSHRSAAAYALCASVLPSLTWNPELTSGLEIQDSYFIWFLDSVRRSCKPLLLSSIT